MGYIKEPYGVDFVVDPRPLTKTDKTIFGEIIAYYKRTGKKMSLSMIRSLQRNKKKKQNHRA
jgi:hypothetical protein